MFFDDIHYIISNVEYVAADFLTEISVWRVPKLCYISRFYRKNASIFTPIISIVDVKKGQVDNFRWYSLYHK